MNGEISRLEAHMAVGQACWAQYADVHEAEAFDPNWTQEFREPMLLDSFALGSIVLSPARRSTTAKDDDRLVITVPHPETKTSYDGITEYTIEGDGVLRQTRWADYRRYARRRLWLVHTYPFEMFSPENGQEVPAERARFLAETILDAVPYRSRTR